MTWGAQLSSCISFALHVSVLHDSVADHFSLMREDTRHIFHNSDLQEFVAQKVKGDGIRSKLCLFGAPLLGGVVLEAPLNL